MSGMLSTLVQMAPQAIFLFFGTYQHNNTFHVTLGEYM